MTKVLLVCLGNICRSPLAEGILKAMVDPNEVMVDSAGTGGYHIGAAPDKRSVAVATRHGIDISNQKARKFNTEDFDTFDFIYAMDKSNLRGILTQAQNQMQREKVKLLLDETNSAINEVPDPYYGGDSGFENVFNLIYTACEVLASNLSNNGGK